MDTELLKTMFLRARDQYETATRWAFIAVVVCLALHVLTFSQFVRFGKELSGVQTEIAQLTRFNSTLTELETRLQQLEQRTTRALDAQIDRILDALISDFIELDNFVTQLRSGEEPTEHSGREPLDTSDSPLQFRGPSDSQIPYMSGEPKFFAFDEELQQQILYATAAHELKDLLRPTIETEILQPRFTELNDAWKKDILPDISGRIDDLFVFLTDHPAPAPEYAELWDEIRKNLEKTINTASDLSFQQPREVDWWASAAGKEASLSTIEKRALNQLSDALHPATIKTLNKQIENVLAQQKVLQSTLQESLVRIQELFEKQQKQFTKLGTPFEFLSFDIQTLVSRFPLLLGVVFAAVTIWPIRRLWQVAWTADMMAAHGQETLPLEWLWGQLWTSLPSQAHHDSEPADYHQRILLESVGRGVFFSGWVGIATWELYGWNAIDPTTLMTYAAFGWGAIIVAQWYRVYFMRRILALKEHKA